MGFQEAEKTYKELKAQHDSGRLNDAAFEAEVGKLRLQDEQGRWWQIGVQTGEWYVHDGQKWNKAKPPAPPPPKVEPSVVPEKPIAPVAAPRAAADKKPETKPEPAAGQARASAIPRLFSPKPAGREGGLSTRVLIGIVAGVAVIGALILVGAFLVLSGTLGGGAKPTATATRAVAVLPSPVLPLPTVRPTDTPLPPPTLVIPPTAVVTATAPITVPTATRTRAAVAATATRRPGTPGPTPTATVNVPPGVYVMKLEADPKPNTDPNNKVGFKLTLLNTTGGMQTFRRWFVRLFQCPEQCTGDTAFRTSYGESLKIDTNVGTGTVTITTPPHANFGPGRCDYTAIPYYTGDNDIAAPFLKTNGQPLYYSFNICQ